MTWEIDFTKKADKEFSKLTRDVQLSIKAYLRNKVQLNPREHGKSLVSSGIIKLWRYRVQNYRIICQIEDKKLSVLVVRVGKRDAVYK